MNESFWGNDIKQVHNGIHYYFARFAAECPQKRLYFTEQREYRAAELFRMSLNAAHDLERLGVKKGDLIGLRATRCIQMGILFFALQFIGAVAVLCDPHCGVREFIAQSGVDMVVDKYISNEERGGGLADGEDWHYYDNGKKTPLHFSDGQTEDAYAGAADIYAPAVIIFTSGSTGVSKAVMLSQFNCMNHAVNYGYGGCYSASDISICIVPMHHVYGLGLWLTTVMHRYEVLFPQRLDAEYIAECIDRYGMTRLGGVPSLLLALAKFKSEKGYSLKSLQAGTMGGAPVTAEQFAFIEGTLGIRLMPVYGMSECIGISALPESSPAELRRTTVGKPLPLNNVVVMDDSGRPCVAGEHGEICVSGPVVTAGYYNNPEATKAAIVDGWLHTGDLGYFDGDGCLRISGRKKDIIIRNGNNLSSVAIEQKLISSPYVRDACVVGVKDDKEGEVPAAAIVLDGGRPSETDSLFGALQKNERPAQVKFVDKIPLTSTGKPDKQAVSAMFGK